MRVLNDARADHREMTNHDAFDRCRTKMLVDFRLFSVSGAIACGEHCRPNSSQRTLMIPMAVTQVVADVVLSAILCVLLHRHKTKFKKYVHPVMCHKPTDLSQDKYNDQYVDNLCYQQRVSDRVCGDDPLLVSGERKVDRASCRVAACVEFLAVSQRLFCRTPAS